MRECREVIAFRFLPDFIGCIDREAERVNGLKSRRIILGITIVLAIALCIPFFGGCGNKDTGNKEPYKIGVVLSASGANEPLGKAEKDSIELFVKQINDAGGINGHLLEVTIKDDASDTNKALEKTNELLSEGVLAIVGSSGTTTTLAMKDATTKSEIPQVCMAAGNSITADNTNWIFRTPPTDALAAERALAYIRDTLKKSKVAILYDSNAFGTDGKRVITELAPTYGIEIVTTESYKSDDTEEGMNTHLTNIQGSNPEVLIVWGTNPGPAIAAKSAKSKGMNIPFVASHGIANAKFIELAGDAANGVVFPAGKMLVWDQALDPSSEQYALVKDFAGSYKAATGNQVNTFAGHGWDAMLILQAALKKAGDNPTPAELRDAIEQTRGLVGTAGTFNYTPENHNGLVLDDLTMVEIVNGKWTAIK
jgi:branched-chain amino acid transport system substrate-binding protein